MCKKGCGMSQSEPNRQSDNQTRGGICRQSEERSAGGTEKEPEKKREGRPPAGAEDVRWDLSDLYHSPEDPALKRDREEVIRSAREFSERYRGRIAALEIPEFLESLQEYERIIGLIRRIGSWSQLLWSTDTGDPQLGKLVQEATELGSDVSQMLVFYNLEWLAMEEEKAREWIESPELRPYRHYLTVSRLYRDHMLDEGQEQVLSAKNVTGRSAWVRYFDETMSSSRYRLDGEELTQQEVLSRLHSPDRDLRKRAHAAMTETLREKSRTLTFVFNTLLADKATNDRLRGYSSWIDSRNLSNQTDSGTVEALVSSVTESYPLVHRFYRLKRRLLGYNRLYDYDRYAPVLKNEETISWQDARQMVLEAFGSFHPRMEQIARKFFDENWIDAAIRPGKRGGAYSASTVADVHPYVFLNYDGQLRDVQTLAHELGHGVHQYLARVQGELQSDTPLTTAETASVFAEMLVFEKLMEKLEDPEEQLALLVGKIDDTIATVFRQISMNRFEDAIHNARRERGELDTEEFSRLWIGTQEPLYGDSVSLTEEYRLWWSYIPHFLHTPGYVYAYAFGELLVHSLYQAWKEEGGDFPERYLKMLEAGGSRWPKELVATMKLDIGDPGFWKNGLLNLESMIGRAEELYRLVGDGDVSGKKNRRD